jgi:hypothetical protein
MCALVRETMAPKYGNLPGKSLLFRCGTPLGLSEMNEAQVLEIAVYSPVWALIYLSAK